MAVTLKFLKLTSRIDLAGGKVFAAGSLKPARRLLELLQCSWTPNAVVSLVKDTKLLETAISEASGLTEKEFQKKSVNLPDLISYDDAGFSGIFDENRQKTRPLLANLSY